MTPTLADFESGARVRYNGLDWAPGHPRTPGTVTEARPNPEAPDGLRAGVQWDHLDFIQSYVITTGTLSLWTLLAPPRSVDVAANAKALAAATAALDAADDAFTTIISVLTPNAVANDLRELADRLRVLGLALEVVPSAAGPEDPQLDNWRVAAGWYATDAAAVVDAWYRETQAKRDTPVPARFETDPRLTAAEHALYVAHYALDTVGDEHLSAERVHQGHELA